MQGIERKRWIVVRGYFGLAPRGGGVAAPPKAESAEREGAAAPSPQEPETAPGRADADFGGRVLPSAPPSLLSRMSPPDVQETKVAPAEPRVPEPEPPVAHPSGSPPEAPKDIAPAVVPREERIETAEKPPEPSTASAPPVVAGPPPSAPGPPKSAGVAGSGPVPVAQPAAPQWTAPPRPPALTSVPPLPSEGPRMGGGLRLNPIRTEGRTFPAPVRTPESLGMGGPPAPPRPAGVPVPPPPPPIGFMAKPPVGQQVPAQGVAPVSFVPPAATPVPPPVPPAPFMAPPMPPPAPVFSAPAPSASAAGVPPLPAMPQIAPMVSPPPPTAAAAPPVPEPKKVGDFFKKMAWKKGPG